jgi:hypothetical protein
MIQGAVTPVKHRCVAFRSSAVLLLNKKKNELGEL